MPAANDDALQVTEYEFQKLLRIGAQLGEYFARKRAQSLAEAQQISHDETRRTRDAINARQVLAEPLYRRALNPQFYDHASQNEVVETYSHAKQWSQADPQAALAVKTIQHEMQTRYGMDLADATASTANSPTRLVDYGPSRYQHEEDAAQSYYVTTETGGVHQTVWGVDLERALAESGASVGDAISVKKLGFQPVTLPDGTQTRRNTWDIQITETPNDADSAENTQVSEQPAEETRVAFENIVNAADENLIEPGARLAQIRNAEAALDAAAAAAQDNADHARADALNERQEAEEALDRTHGKGTPTTSKEAAEHNTATQTWDSMQARADWARKLADDGIDPQSVRAAMTADTALTRPATTMTEPANRPHTRVNPKAMNLATGKRRTKRL